MARIRALIRNRLTASRKHRQVLICDLATKYAYVLRRFNPDSNFPTANLDNGDFDTGLDQNSFPDFTAENKHVFLPELIVPSGDVSSTALGH
jgi:hypothetical protein